jgi:hypothetical protein
MKSEPPPNLPEGRRRKSRPPPNLPEGRRRRKVRSEK